MSSNKEKEVRITEYFLKSFEEKSPIDYDILDSMFTESKHYIIQDVKKPINSYRENHLE